MKSNMKKYMSPRTAVVNVRVESLLTTGSVDIDSVNETGSGNSDNLTVNGFQGLSPRAHSVWDDAEDEDE